MTIRHASGHAPALARPPCVRSRSRSRRARPAAARRRAGRGRRAAVPRAGRRPGGVRRGRRASATPRSSSSRQTIDAIEAGPAPRSSSTRSSCRSGITTEEAEADAIAAHGPVGRRARGDRRRARDPVRPPRGRPVPRPGPAVRRAGLSRDVPVQRGAPEDLRRGHAAAPPRTATSTAPRSWPWTRSTTNATPEHAATITFFRQLNAVLGLIVAPLLFVAGHVLGGADLVPLRPRPDLPRRPLDPHPGAAARPHARGRRHRARRAGQPAGADRREPRPRRRAA